MGSSLALPHIGYAMRYSLVLAHRHDATLSNLRLALAWGWGRVGSSRGLPHICYAMKYFLALARRHDAMLSDLLLALAWGWGGVGCDNVLWTQELYPNAMTSSLVLAHRGPPKGAKGKHPPQARPDKTETLQSEPTQEAHEAARQQKPQPPTLPMLKLMMSK